MRWKWKIQLDSRIYEYIIGENQHQHHSFIIDDTTTGGDQHIRFYVERDAVLLVELFIAGAERKIIIDCILRGEGAEARIMGAYILDSSDKVQIITTQHHVVPHTRSTLMVKGLLCHGAQAEYHGTIRIEKDAHGSYASQENKNILWDGSARVVSVPNLEVLTHDVQCFHGSATGQFDEEQLFYAASRGIDEQRTRRILAQAFFANIFTDEILQQKIHELIFLSVRPEPVEGNERKKESNE